MHPWVESVKQLLIPLVNDENASQMKAYMRDQYAFLGIKSTPRREALKPLFIRANLPSIAEIPQVVDDLWMLPEREYQLVAIDLLIKVKRQLPSAMLADLERWITTKSWWDTVDMLATHIAGSFYVNHPDAFNVYFDKWCCADNLWLRRTSLLYQLKFKERTDAERLFELIRFNQHDGDFFIQKAIGWTLREYAKTSPEQVRLFIEQQNIQGLAKREALKHMKT